MIRKVVVLLFGCWLLGVMSVAAHSDLQRAEPAPGATLRRSPAEIRLTFHDAVTAESTIVLFGAGFAAVEGVTAQLDMGSLRQLFAPLPPLPPDVYTVQWTAVSVDGHSLSGSYTFQVVAGGIGGWVGWLVGGVLVLLVGGVWWYRRSLLKV